MSTAIIFGGYGVFGSWVARELAQKGIGVTVAGRDLRRGESLAQSLGPNHRALAVDLVSRQSCLAAVEGQMVAVNCAGSLVDVGPNLLDACLQAGCHYADIAVERDHAAMVRAYDERFRQAGLVAVYGCSSLPAISGALALVARSGSSAVPESARVTLFIGNRNAKGQAAIDSFVRVLGQPIQAPQGSIRGFRDREVVALPPPFGKRAVFNFDSPDYDLLPDLLGVRAVRVKVGFELRLATYGFALLALLGWNWRWLSSWLDKAGTALGRLGSSGGAIMTELFYADGSRRSAAVVARQDGQRVAALPCAVVAQTLYRGVDTRGVMTAYELLPNERLLEQLSAHGFPCTRS